MPQDIVITPNRGSTTSGAQIAFTGYSGATSIYLKVLPDSSLSFEGSAGQLFSITDNLSSGTIFSVNDITGIPSFDVNANGLVRLAPYAGNVALGTTATSGRLQINTGSATTIGQIIQVASGQSANYLEMRNSSGTITGAFTNSGGFCIGNTTNRTGTGTGLDITGSLATNDGVGQIQITHPTNNDIRLAIGFHTSNNYSFFQSYQNAIGSFPIVLNPAFDGRVAIGNQTSPGAKLHIYNLTAGTKGQIIQGATSQTANLQEWQNSAGSVLSYINASGSFGGSLMSGTINSAYNFSATGLASGKTLSTDGTGVLSWATGGGGGPTISDDTSTNATRYVNFAAATTGTLSTIYTSSTKLTFNPSTGDFTAGGNITANSDIKIKKDIKTIENALEKVKNLRGVSFTRIGTDIKNVGVIAQEVEAVVPELVRESDGLKSVAYGNITALLIEAIKEQSKKIEELENKLCQLTSSQS